MGEYSIPLQIIKHRGFFDHEKLIQTLQGWFPENGYDPAVDLKQKPSMLRLGHDFLYKIKGNKKVTDYIKFYVEESLKEYNVQGVELIQDGKKIKTSEAEILIEVSAKPEADWQKKFAGKGEFIKWLGEILEKRILKYRINDYYEDKLIAEVLGLCGLLRDTMGQEV